MSYRPGVMCSLAAFLIIAASAVSWSSSVIEVPPKPTGDKEKLTAKHPSVGSATRKSNPNPQEGTLPKPGVVGEPIVSIDGTRVYYPYIPPRHYAPYPYYGQYSYYDHAGPPILFFNDMVDMALIWDRFRHRFKWEPIVPPRPYVIPPTSRTDRGTEYEEAEAEVTTERVRAATTLVGEVVRIVRSRTNPKIVVQANDKESAYPVAQDAIILRAAVNERAAEALLDEVHVGDRVTLRFNEEGIVDTIRAQYKIISGKVQAIAKRTILLETGEAFKVAPQADVLLPGNVKGKLEDIKVGSIVRAQASPISGNAYVVEIMSRDADEEPPAKEEKDQGVEG